MIPGIPVCGGRNFFIFCIFRIIVLAGNGRQIFEFKGLIRKILRNKDLGSVSGARSEVSGRFEIGSSFYLCKVFNLHDLQVKYW
jgi:hypothetical protein